ncbi:tyrosine-type recombinase/integrase [Sphingomonas sp. RS2018]
MAVSTFCPTPERVNRSPTSSTPGTPPGGRRIWGDLRIHDLRHSAASFMINAGIDLFAVGRVLGHADHKSTMRYSHLANDTLLAAVEAGASKQQVDWTAA